LEIEPGLTIARIETFTKGLVGIVRLTTNDGRQGFGQLSTYDTARSASLTRRAGAWNLSPNG
jgi:hypothetical protein